MIRVIVPLSATLLLLLLTSAQGDDDTEKANPVPQVPFPAQSLREDDGQISSPVQNIVFANNEFMQKYYQVVLKTSPPNFVFSPFSIVTLLGMLRAGARDKTLKEIQSAMNVRSTAAGQLYNGFSDIFCRLKTSAKKSNSTFTSSNKLFIQKGFDIRTEFQGILKEKFQAPAQQLDFSQENAASVINDAVARETNQNIQNLIDPGVLSNFTRMIAVNVLYLKAQWVNTFSGLATQPQDFYKLNGETIQLETMATEDYFKVTDIPTLKSKVIVLPYVGKQMEMVILLPNERNGLPDVEQRFFSYPTISMSDITDSVANQSPKNIILNLPKFELETSQDLQEPLKNLGIQKAFVQFQADFSRISATENELYVSKILQKAFLKVNEVGSEAGAASFGAVFTPLSIGPPVEEIIKVDHPFIGFIRHVDTGLVIFTFRKME